MGRQLTIRVEMILSESCEAHMFGMQAKYTERLPRTKAMLASGLGLLAICSGGSGKRWGGGGVSLSLGRVGGWGGGE